MEPRDIAQALLLFVRIIEHKNRSGICGSKAIRDEWKDDALELIGVDLYEDPIGKMHNLFEGVRKNEIGSCIFHISQESASKFSQSDLFAASALFDMIKYKNNATSKDLPNQKALKKAAKTYDYIARGFKFGIKGAIKEAAIESGAFQEELLSPTINNLRQSDAELEGSLGEHESRTSSYRDATNHVRFDSKPQIHEVPNDRIARWERQGYNPEQLSPPPPSLDVKNAAAEAVDLAKKLHKISEV